jgi:hypothetical protein
MERTIPRDAMWNQMYRDDWLYILEHDARDVLRCLFFGQGIIILGSLVDCVMPMISNDRMRNS